MRYAASSGDRNARIEVGEDGHVRQITVDNQALDVDWQPVGGAVPQPGGGGGAGHYSLLVGGRSYEAYVRTVEEEDGRAGSAELFEVTIRGRPYLVRLEDERTRALAGLAGATHERGDIAIKAPMPGLVANVMAAVGEPVERGQTVVVLEAMKMENDLGAPRSGVIRSIRVTNGQTVNQGAVLAVVGDPEGAAPAADVDDEE
jgi:biotin carboxyl carrier protein